MLEAYVSVFQSFPEFHPSDGKGRHLRGVLVAEIAR
jgi:hypothetical protein